jgi:anti-sigma factor RsiW
VSRPEAHVDLDDLALVALGEPLPGEQTQHLGVCSRCRAELDQIAATVQAARSITEDDLPVHPPAYVWERVRAEALPPPPRPARAVTAGSRRTARWRQWLPAPALLAGAASVIAVAVIALPERSADPVTVASTPMAALDNRGVVGTADVQQTSAGRELAVTVSNLAAQDGAFYEVWLIAPDVSRMVSLGVVAGDGATLPIPEGLDLAGYPLVDISLEPMDGDPLHSKVSLSRGDLSV